MKSIRPQCFLLDDEAWVALCRLYILPCIFMDVYGAFPGLGQYHNPKIYGKVICMWYMLDFPRLPSVGIPNGGGASGFYPTCSITGLRFCPPEVVDQRIVCLARQDCCYVKQTMESRAGKRAGFCSLMPLA